MCLQDGSHALPEHLIHLLLVLVSTVACVADGKGVAPDMLGSRYQLIGQNRMLPLGFAISNAEDGDVAFPILADKVGIP